MYSDKIAKVRDALHGEFPDPERVARVLVLACQHGAGDALAGWILSKHTADEARKWLASYFPGYTPTSWSAEGSLMMVLAHRTGNAKVDRVLEALDKAATCGDGDIARWLEEEKPKND